MNLLVGARPKKLAIALDHAEVREVVVLEFEGNEIS